MAVSPEEMKRRRTATLIGGGSGLALGTVGGVASQRPYYEGAAEAARSVLGDLRGKSDVPVTRAHEHYKNIQRGSSASPKEYKRAIGFFQAHDAITKKVLGSTGGGEQAMIRAAKKAGGLVAAKPLMFGAVLGLPAAILGTAGALGIAHLTRKKDGIPKTAAVYQEMKTVKPSAARQPATGGMARQNAIIKSILSTGMAGGRPVSFRELNTLANNAGYRAHYRGASPTRYAYGLGPSIWKSSSAEGEAPVKTAEQQLEEYILSEQPRVEETKVAHPLDHYEDEAFAQFGSGDTPYPYANPIQPLQEARTKLAGAVDAVASELSRLEADYAIACDSLLSRTKTACIEGTSLGDVTVAWGSVAPDEEFIKAAFQYLTPKLRDTFGSYDALGASLQKHAAVESIVNTEHPLVQTFADWCDVLGKLAHARVVKEELESSLAQTDAFMKRAFVREAVGTAGKVLSGAGRLAQRTGGAARGAAETLGVKDLAKLQRIEDVTRMGAKGTMGLAAAGTASEIHKQKYRPEVRAAGGAARRLWHGAMSTFNPASAAYQQDIARIYHSPILG
jgi:hypothetical protein